MKPRQTLRSSRNATLDRLADRLRSELRSVRKNPSDVDAVHDARVAARRLLAAGELWATQATPWPGVRDRLPRILRNLGHLRNLDIALGLVRRGTKEDEAARRALGKHLRKLRKKERERVGEWLTEKKIDRIDRAMKKVIREVRRKPVLDAPSPSDLAPHFARLSSLFASPAWAPGPEEAHAIRREVRRLRYAHETLEWAYEPGDFLRVVKLLQKIQEVAGDWQDRCVIERFASKAMRRGKVSMPLDGFLGRIQAESRTLSEKFIRFVTELIDLRQLIVGEGR